MSASVFSFFQKNTHLADEPKNMAKKYKNKYRIESIRLQNWDYRWAGAYFITICTNKREHFFGKIFNGKMQLSNIGVIADILWHEITNHAKNVNLGEFIVMPNHIHGILILNDNNDNDTIVDDISVDGTSVETGRALSLHPQPQPRPHPHPQRQRLQPQTIGQQRFPDIGKNSVSSIIGGYKSAVTKHARRLGYYFAWQPRFYDHIIRDEKSFNNISNYIINNPVKWENDKFFKTGEDIVSEPLPEYRTNNYNDYF